MVVQNKNLTQWVDNYTSDLYSWAFHKVSNTDLAQDLVQDTFLAAAEKIESFKGESSPKTWLFSILNHKIIDHYRKKMNQTIPHENESLSRFFETEGAWQEKRRPRHWSDDDEEEHLLDNHDFRAILKKCLDALPEKWNLCVKLKYLSGKNGEEICQELAISSSNYWQIIHRAKLQLRECVDENWFEN
jgi:RNA polymerase sigma-70 factor (TIGR02943 family)